MNLNKGYMFVDQLDKSRTVGKDRWIACCPAHDDRSPSLSIRQLEDGRVLLHCFAGCSAQDVVESVGLRMTDLFPDELKNTRSELRTNLRVSYDEIFVAIGDEMIERGELDKMSDAERKQYAATKARIKKKAAPKDVLTQMEEWFEEREVMK
jgi:hypothetical protein